MYLCEQARDLGVVLFVDTDDRLRAFPRHVVRKHLDFARMARENAASIKLWLKQTTRL